MRVTGAATLAAPAGTVLAALGDRDLLAGAIPGCERLDVTGAGRCQLTVTTAIAAVSGTYAGEAAMIERPAPGPAGGPAGDLAGDLVANPDGGLVVAAVSAAGNRGSASAEITLRLTPAAQGATQVSYVVDATVSGPVAGIGQRMLASIASRLADEFLATLGGLLSEQPAVGALAVGALAVGPSVVEPQLVESMVVGPTVIRRPADADGDAGDLDQPRAGTRPGIKAGMVAGGAVGLAGIVIGAALGRRNRPGGRGSR